MLEQLTTLASGAAILGMGAVWFAHTANADARRRWPRLYRKMDSHWTHAMQRFCNWLDSFQGEITGKESEL